MIESITVWEVLSSEYYETTSHGRFLKKEDAEMVWNRLYREHMKENNITMDVSLFHEHSQLYEILPMPIVSALASNYEAFKLFSMVMLEDGTLVHQEEKGMPCIDRGETLHHGVKKPYHQGEGLASLDDGTLFFSINVWAKTLEEAINKGREKIRAKSI